MVQDSSDGDVPQYVMNALNNEKEEIWNSIMASPNSYVMGDLEFGTFNYYSVELAGRNRDIARRAIQRYWNSRGGVDGTP